MSKEQHEQFMEHALALAEQAAQRGEVPVGALVVIDEQIVGEGFNRRECDQDPTAHAEMFALKQAAEHVGSWRLCGATLYVTLEPCPMCAGAIVNSRVDHLVYGCPDPKAGAVRSLYCLCEDPRLNHRVEVVRGVQQQRCSEMLSDFFAKLRSSKIGEVSKNR